MVAYANSCCNTAAAVTSTSTGRRPAPPSAVARRRPLPTSSSRNKGGNGKKARTTTGRRCAKVIRRKMEALKRLVPSGGADGDHHGDDGVDELLFRAADYIVRLQVQVKAMQLMVDVLEHTKDS